MIADFGEHIPATLMLQPRPSMIAAFVFLFFAS
jgi:hypothetical protein